METELSTNEILMEDGHGYEMDADHADDNLQRIVDDKLELKNMIDSWGHRHELKADEIADMRIYMEEAFDDKVSSRWSKLVSISGSIGWPVKIPPFETLTFVTPRQREDREWAKRNRAVLTNPESYCVEGDL